MGLEFDHRTLGQRVRFGAGRAVEHVVAEVSDRGARRVMLIATGSEQHVSDELSRRLPVVLPWRDVVQHVPIELAREARRRAQETGVDLIVSIGGGSATGLAKAVAMELAIPIVAVPTTYAGSEATNVWGLTEAARKTTGIDDQVLPQTIVYDAELTLSLPIELAVSSGLNALAHCVDALWAPRADPINTTIAAEAMRALAAGLRDMVSDPGGLSGRETTQYGAYLAAVAYASAGSGLHHKICHALGGRFGLPHAPTHAVVLPYVTAFNIDAAPDAGRRIGHALGAEDGLSALIALRDDLDAPTALLGLGFPQSAIPEAVDLILPLVPPSNPRPVDAPLLTALLEAACGGAPPRELRES